MSEYALALVLSSTLPFLLSFYPGLRFYRNSRSLFLSISLIVFIFGGWDVFATYRGHWDFNSDYVWNFRIINLPLEEVLFFIVIPFCCIFTWEAICHLKDRLK